VNKGGYYTSAADNRIFYYGETANNHSPHGEDPVLFHLHKIRGAERLIQVKSNILAQLSVDADLGPEAARYLQSFNRQLRDDAIGKLQSKSTIASTSQKQTHPIHSQQQILSSQNRTLWEAVR
jgi:hypothetical protein